MEGDRGEGIVVLHGELYRRAFVFSSAFNASVRSSRVKTRPLMETSFCPGAREALSAALPTRTSRIVSSLSSSRPIENHVDSDGVPLRCCVISGVGSGVYSSR